MKNFHRFKGTESYVVTDELMSVVNVALELERPLLVKGEPGTGKTLLAHHIARALGLPIIVWNVKSTTKARDGLYTYDTVSRLNDARFGEGDVRDIGRYIKPGPLGRAFSATERTVLLIDEIDKADIEFPNDLLSELDEMSFEVIETGEKVTAKQRPVTIITSNSEKELPDAFLRRCVFHFIAFPGEKKMREIVEVHHPGLEEGLLESALKIFYGLREVPGIGKPPSTSELIDWIRVLRASGTGLPVDGAGKPENIPFLGALLKNREDAEALSRKPAGR
ncbi:MoxR family ATPase [bacterium]|nr:MAG: MoxR family ATPase [bacterium]